MRARAEDRFWAKANKTEGCWAWTGTKVRSGYGLFRKDGRRQVAHRISYEFTNGTIPDGMQIDHICHNRACVNPDHLRAVTNKQNMENRASAHKNNVSGIRGVAWYKPTKKWVAYVTHNGEQIRLGYFMDKEEAGAAALAKRLELFTHNDVDRAA